MGAIFMSRVEGLGNVQALFYPHATSVAEVHEVRRLASAVDRRRSYREIFRVERLDNRGETTGVVRPNWYLLTGALETRRRVDIFFVSPSDGNARRFAQSRSWDDMRLYRCEECVL